MCSTHLLPGLLLHTDRRRLECLLSSHRRLLQIASDMAEGLDNIDEDTEAGEIIFILGAGSYIFSGLALFKSMEAEHVVLSNRIDVNTMTKALQDEMEREKLLSGQLGMLAGLVWVCFLVKSLL